MSRKVVTQFIPGGRMGNRMFHYAFGYILAKLRSCDFYHEELPNFGIENTIHNASNLNDAIYTWHYGEQNADIDMLVKHEGDVVINSYLQKSRFYVDYKEELRDLFGVKDVVNSPNMVKNKNKLVLHIRETDYITINAFLGYDYYKKLISDSNFKEVIIVTDNTNSSTVQKLVKEDGCTLSTEGVVDTFTVHSGPRAVDDFKTLLFSENIAISQSSFSWWAAFLGNHKKIIFPYKTGVDMWPINPGIDDIDLYFNIDKVTQQYII